MISTGIVGQREHQPKLYIISNTVAEKVPVNLHKKHVIRAHQSDSVRSNTVL
jgi:hypothetical protein